MPATALGEPPELIVRWCGATTTCSMSTTIVFDSHGSETLAAPAPLMPSRQLFPTSLSRLALIPRPQPTQHGGRRLAACRPNARSVTSAPLLPGSMGFKSRLTGRKLTTHVSSPSLTPAIGLEFTTIGVPSEDSSPRAHPS